MKRFSMIAVALLLIGIASGPVVSCAPGGDSDELMTLFDGSSLGGWNRVGDANWQLGDGAVSADSGNGFLVSDGSYGDFELQLEFWVDEPANSGIFIRCSDPDEISSENCYEVNIFDTRPDPTYRTGGIVNYVAPASVINTGNQWNSYDIRAEGERFVITLNGTETVDFEDGTHAEGPFALQYGAGTVRFRNVQIRELE